MFVMNGYRVDVSQAMEEHQLDPFDALDLMKAEDGRFLGGGDVRIGDFILLVDSDTRIPIDCILPTISELLQSPQVGFTQHLITPMQVISWLPTIRELPTNVCQMSIKPCAQLCLVPQQSCRQNELVSVSAVSDGI